MINYKNAKFIKSVSDVSIKPHELARELVFVGRSNVGKSTLINSLVGTSLAKTSSKPGKTTLLNYFDIDHTFYLVDAPGYGYAASGVHLDEIFSTLMNAYFDNNKDLKCAFLLIDSRRGVGPMDKELLEYFSYYDIPYYLLFTKADKITQKEKAACLKSIPETEDKERYLFTSSLDPKSINELRKLIEYILK
ncbi:MAG: ribosome biogenesis GTP-binding protein YihA/YsxC [Coprobacillus sp.]|nr:ribosome biogenesis GTP-binding protein YihA/YsxC [Coprobacillus sp.]